MAGTDAPSTLRPDDREVFQEVAHLAGQLEQLLEAAGPLMASLREALLRVAPEEA